jgi:hypothetical protein
MCSRPSVGARGHLRTVVLSADRHESLGRKAGDITAFSWRRHLAWRLREPVIRFKIGGGRYPNEACLNPIVDNQIVRTATGDDTPTLSDASWTTSATARLSAKSSQSWQDKRSASKRAGNQLFVLELRTYSGRSNGGEETRRKIFLRRMDQRTRGTRYRSFISKIA